MIKFPDDWSQHNVMQAIKYFPFIALISMTNKKFLCIKKFKAKLTPFDQIVVLLS